MLPLTVGDGNMVLQKVIEYGAKWGKPPQTQTFPPTLNFNDDGNDDNTLSPNLIICSAFAKMFVLGCSLNSGFIGGFVFPTILVGVMAGVVCYQQFSYIPIGMCVSCFMSALPAGICPMPFTLAALAIFTQYNGLYQTVPIYIATITSYTIVCGSGIFSFLQKRGLKNNSENNEKDNEGKGIATTQSAQEAQKSYAIEAYLNSKRSKPLDDE